MSEAFSIYTGIRYAFAPSPDTGQGSLHKIYIVFEGSDGRRWTAGTELIAATANSTVDFCDGLNTRLGLDHEEWTAFAERIFAGNPYRNSAS